MDTLFEKSSSVVRSKHDKPKKQAGTPYFKPPDKSPDKSPPTHYAQNNPVTIVIPPARHTPANTRLESPTTPTRTTGKRHLEEVTPTARRTRRPPPEHQEKIQLQPLLDPNPTQPPEEDQPMEEDDAKSDADSDLSYQDLQIENPSQGQEDDQIQSETDRLMEDLLTILLNAEDIVNKIKEKGHLEAINKEEDITHALRRLSESLPIIPANVHIEPILNEIGKLSQKVNSLTESLDAQRKMNLETRTLQDSIHSPTPPPPTWNPSASPNPNNHRPASFSSAVQNGKTPPQQHPTTTSNPRLAHHQSRLVVQFPPNGIPANNRRDPSNIVTMINAALSNTQEASHIKVVAANYNKQGNIILSTRTDQTAAELSRHEATIKPVLAAIGGTQNVTIREDKRWFKIQIDGVSTGALTIGEGRILYPGERIHNELITCNPLYSQLTKHIVAKPRWLRINEELMAIPRSSLVIAFDYEQAAKAILNLKSMAAFGRHCSMRLFQDRPPVTQCQKCWSFDHATERCNNETVCRMCGGSHPESDHQTTEPGSCDKCKLAQELGDMDTSADGQCSHQFKCTNCVIDYEKDHEHPADSRRCPTRIEKYGSARDNNRRTTKNGNPWTKVKPKKTGPKKKMPKPDQPLPSQPPPSQHTPIQPSSSQGPSQNRYGPLYEQADSSLPQLPEHIAQLTADIPHVQPCI